jgi:hypothetical protein
MLKGKGHCVHYEDIQEKHSYNCTDLKPHQMIEVSDQPHTSAVSKQGKDPKHPLNKRSDGPHGWSDVLF